MNINEIIQQPGEPLVALKRAIGQDIRVSIPGMVTAYNPADNTVSVQPTVMDGQTRLPILQDVPVFFPGGGSVCMTFPVNIGDECLVIFSDTAIDNWFHSGEILPPHSRRRHSLSDGFALIGFRSRAHAVEVTDDLFSIRRKTPDGWETLFSVDKEGQVSAEFQIEEITDVEIDEITKE